MGAGTRLNSSPRHLGPSCAPLVGDHFATVSGSEDGPSGSEVESINLEDFMGFTGVWNARENVPTPCDLSAEGATCVGAINVTLTVLSEEPLNEALQSEDTGPVWSFTDA